MPVLAFNLGFWEIALILLIVLLIFGHRLPGVGRALGRSVTEFKEGIKEGSEGKGDGKGTPKPPVQN
jgi:sec-independent protein translocase protein TatA